MNDLKHKDVWYGTHRGIGFEINRRTIESFAGITPEHDCWSYYIYLPEPMIPEAIREHVLAKLGEPDEKGRRFHKYMASDLANIHWHYGITFYEHHPDNGYSPAYIKAGCDYDHAWDEDVNWSYDLEYVLRDVQRTIDEARERFSMRWRCHATGEWFDTEAEAESAHKAWWDNYRAERAKRESPA